MGVANCSPEELETSFFISLLMASDSGEDTGISLNDRNVLIIGFCRERMTGYNYKNCRIPFVRQGIVSHS